MVKLVSLVGLGSYGSPRPPAFQQSLDPAGKVLQWSRPGKIATLVTLPTHFFWFIKKNHGQMMKTKSMKEYLSKELIWDPGIASLVRDCEEEIWLRK